MTSAEEERKNEVDLFVADQRSQFTIVKTIQTYSGDVYDWVDAKSVPGSQLQPPFKIPEKKRSPLTELDQFPELRGPPGTIPMLRPTFDLYVKGETSAMSLQDYILNHIPQGQPMGQKRLYGGYRMVVANNGIHSDITQFPEAPESGSFNILEVSAACNGPTPATTQEIVGAAVSRGAAGLSGDTLRFNVEFATAGTAQGNNVGGWNENVTGWVPYELAPYGPV
jgi:hypothetical protein